VDSTQQVVNWQRLWRLLDKVRNLFYTVIHSGDARGL